MATLSRIGIALVVASLVSACGGPALQGVPRPNTAVVAGAAAATAAAITLADPAAAARNVDAEHEAHIPAGREPGPTRESAPADVLDRLDAAEREAKEPGHGAPSQTPAEPDATTSPASPFFPTTSSAPAQPPPPKSSFTPRWGNTTAPVIRQPRR